MPTNCEDGNQYLRRENCRATLFTMGDSTEYVFYPGQVVGMLLSEMMIERWHQLERSLVNRGTDVGSMMLLTLFKAA